MLWTDYFKPPHFEKYPELHTLVNEATKLAGAAGTKGELDAAKADELLAKIDEIAASSRRPRRPDLPGHHDGRPRRRQGAASSSRTTQRQATARGR